MSEEEGKDTTIAISSVDKKRLDAWKIHRREPYKEVISRILDGLETMRASGQRLPNEKPVSYPSYIKGLIDSMTKAEKENTID